MVSGTQRLSIFAGFRLGIDAQKQQNPGKRAKNSLGATVLPDSFRHCSNPAHYSAVIVAAPRLGGRPDCIRRIVNR